MSNVYWKIQWRWARKYVIELLILIVALVLLFVIAQATQTNADQDSAYAKKVHICISTARELNQNLYTNYNPQSCVNNPNYLN